MNALIAAAKTAGCQFIQGAARTIDSETSEKSKRFKSYLETTSLVGRVTFGVLGLTCLACAATSLLAVEATSLSFNLLSLYFSVNFFKICENLPSLHDHEIEISAEMINRKIFYGLPKVRKCLLRNTYKFDVFYDLLTSLESSLSKISEQS